MGSITDVRCVLTQKTLDAFYDKFHIPEEVHPVLPNRNDTMHERPAGKISKRSDNARDPTKVKIVERERNEDEPPLLDTSIGRTLSLLPVTPARAKSELEASVDRLFDEGGSGNQTEQGDSADGGQGTDIRPVSEAADTVVEDVAPLQPRRQRKRKTVVVDAGDSSHSPKRLWEDHGTPSGTSVGGKSMSADVSLCRSIILDLADFIPKPIHLNPVTIRRIRIKQAFVDYNLS
ncbi:hypothetical protein Tco_0972285 [Tanacetum coccineum]